MLEPRRPEAASGFRNEARNGLGKATEASGLKTDISGFDLNSLGPFLHPSGRRQFLASERVLGMASGRGVGALGLKAIIFALDLNSLGPFLSSGGRRPLLAFELVL